MTHIVLPLPIPLYSESSGSDEGDDDKPSTLPERREGEEVQIVSTATRQHTDFVAPDNLIKY